MYFFSPSTPSNSHKLLIEPHPRERPKFVLKMCHDIITLWACGHLKQLVPDPCHRLVLTNFCAGLVRNIDVVGHSCKLCEGNVRKFRELTGRSIPVPRKDSDDVQKRCDEDCDDVKNDEGERGRSRFRMFQKMVYTDDAYEGLKKECYKRVWSRCRDE